jgi:hypothetical protein
VDGFDGPVCHRKGASKLPRQRRDALLTRRWPRPEMGCGACKLIVLVEHAPAGSRCRTMTSWISWS